MALDGNHIQMTWISWPFYCADCACICAGCCFRRWCSATGLRLRLLAQIGSALPERLARCSSVAAFAVLQVKQTAVKNKDILTTSCECFLAFAGLLLYVALQCPAWVVLWVFCLNLRPASKAKKQKAWKHHEQTTTPAIIPCLLHFYLHNARISCACFNFTGVTRRQCVNSSFKLVVLIPSHMETTWQHCSQMDVKVMAGQWQNLVSFYRRDLTR